ncbi:HAD family hydrolase [Pseudomonas aeruginosa]|uniref:HAD family hydrolase n=1 Tax=Pseudomonas aeruginosa TaxID=287 RepID=UPI003CC67DF6
MKILWVSDADNTLWDTDQIYINAQLKLLAIIEESLGIQAVTSSKLQYIREIDQKISTLHHLGLRYPTEILISALSRRLQGASTTIAVKTSLLEGMREQDPFSMDAAKEFRDQINKTPPLREGVLDGLKELQENQAIVIIATEGSLDRIKRHLSDHKISHLITLCLEGSKTKSLYQRIAKLHPDRHAWSIGDQLTRDIQPAAEAGFRTLYFPGGFHPFWQQATKIPSDTIEIENYRAGVGIAIGKT